MNRYKTVYETCIKLLNELAMQNNNASGHYRHILTNIATPLSFLASGQLTPEQQDREILRQSIKSFRTYRRLLENKDFKELELQRGYFNVEGRIPLNKEGTPERITTTKEYIEYAEKHFNP